VFETTCRLIETGTAPTATAKSRIDAVPYTVLSTYAGAVFHSLPFASTSRVVWNADRSAAAVFMCSVPRSGFGLQLLRPWPDLLCGQLCTRGASVRATSGRPTLSEELSRAAEACSAICPSSRTTKDRDASGFTT